MVSALHPGHQDDGGEGPRVHEHHHQDNQQPRLCNIWANTSGAVSVFGQAKCHGQQAFN